MDIIAVVAAAALEAAEVGTINDDSVIDAVNRVRGLALFDGLFVLGPLWHENVVFHYLALLGFLAVFAAALKDAAVGAPFVPGLRIRSGVLPAAFCCSIRLRFACMFSYRLIF